jgi:hypothetical protein
MQHMPSNAPEGSPTRNEQGYFLWYPPPVDPGADGEPVPSEPRLIWGDQTYADAGEIDRALNNTTLRSKTSGLENERKRYVLEHPPEPPPPLLREAEEDEEETSVRSKRGRK